MDKNTLSKTVSFKHPRSCLKLHKKYDKNIFGDVLTNILYHGDVLTNFWGRFDQFGDVLTRGRFDCNPTRAVRLIPYACTWSICVKIQCADVLMSLEEKHQEFISSMIMLNGSTATFHVMILNWGKTYSCSCRSGYLSELMRMGFSIPKNITIH